MLRQAAQAAKTATSTTSTTSAVLIRPASGNPTGLTGILQHPNPKPTLEALYNATLDELAQKFPPHSLYRKSVENLTRARLQIIQNNDVIEQIEQKIGCGLIEEVIIQADEELELLRKLAEWKVWENLEESPLPDQWVYFGKKV